MLLEGRDPPPAHFGPEPDFYTERDYLYKHPEKRSSYSNVRYSLNRLLLSRLIECRFQYVQFPYLQVVGSYHRLPVLRVLHRTQQQYWLWSTRLRTSEARVLGFVLKHLTPAQSGNRFVSDYQQSISHR